jgi:hypothetical protein
LKENFDRFQFDIYKEKEMADFRKCVYAFAVLALLLGSAVTANAQIQCIGNAAVPAALRSEGLTELIGDITLNCTGTPTGWPTAIVPPATTPSAVLNVNGGVLPPANTTPATVNIQVFFNSNVTSRIADGSEAMLLIDDPAGGVFCAYNVPYSAVGGPTDATVTGNACNALQARQPTDNSILFLGVPVLPPGTSGIRTYRIVNVRVNANTVAAGGSGLPGQVIAQILATPATSGTAPGGATISSSFPLSNSTLNVGGVQAGLTQSVRNAVSDDSLSTSFGFQQCVNRGTGSSARASSGFARLRFEEGFATAFKTRTTAQAAAGAACDATTCAAVDPSLYTSPAPVAQNVPGTIYNSESGYYNPPLTGLGGVTNPGLADFGTRLKATFTNIPAGVRLWVSAYEVAGTGGNRARLIGSETGSFFAVTPVTDVFGLNGSVQGIDVAEVPIVNGTGTAVWEIVAHNPQQIGRVEFSVHTAFSTFDVANNLPAAGPTAGQVSLSFAPTPPSFSATDGARRQGASFPIPRFVDIGSARNLFRINVCVTNLLFPFVTAQAGFDTGLAIANTSRDPFGTGVQAGTFTLSAFGANAPAAITTPTVTSDAVYTTLASAAMPNFQGYVIAQCRFQFAHGFAFISDLGARNLAMGYLALVIPARGDTTRTPDPFANQDNGTGEQLGN